ncbi:MAG TPA: prolyl oligopeptidase family serine peptidase [Burkholderiaceae bacterium]|nr:prolyl oligopeptidase family serine peptidase [Burkholderiaceae bacterium]
MKSILLIALALLAACTTTPEPPAVLAPNANLLAQGIPPVPMALVERVARYTDFRGHGFVEWHPVREEMLVAHRKAGDNKAQIYRLAQPMGALEQITDGDEPVTNATWEPREGKYIVFERSRGGDEADQLYRLDLPSRQTTLLTNPDEAHNIAGWIRASSTLLYTAVPLDRTAAGGSRPTIHTTLWAIDPAQPATTRRKVAELPGPGWYAGGVSEDGELAAFIRYRSANESQVWLIDLANGQTRQVMPAPGESVRATHFSGGFSKDGKRLFVVSDRASEFREQMVLDLASGALSRVTSHIPWDVNGGAASHDGRWLALQINADGRDELRLFDAASGKELAAPSVPAGGIGNAMDFHRRTHRLAMSINSAQGPNQVLALDPASGRTVPWTRAHAPAGVDTRTFGDQRIVRWKSFDGVAISGLLNMPPARFTGKRPVIVAIHGGPEAQATMGFLGRWNYFVQEMGIAIVQPNVRGSTGYGKTFLTLDNGLKREDSVKDIGALLDWIAQQPDLDASRVLVTGGSYGGYMTLATAVHYSDRIVGGIPVVGPSNFVTFLTNTESYRRDLRRVEYGDERDPAIRAWMERTAPLNNADKIRKPLFVVQGKNDPRVPFTESEQIVAKVRANGLPVWYLRGENEGHGFVRKENVDFEFYATVLFLEWTLLK